MKRIIALLGLLALAIGLAGCGSTASNPTPTTKYTLTITTDGQGTVTPASGLSYEAGTVVTLTPSAVPGWDFSNWDGTDAASIAGNKITMDGNKSIKAVFTGYPFWALTTGSVGVYHETISQDGTTLSEFDVTATVVGPASFNGDPAAVKVKASSSVDPNTVDYMYFKPVSNGIIVLGQESGQVGPPEVITSTAINNPAPTLATLKAGQSFVTQQNAQTITLTALGGEVVTVPAGTFNALKLMKTTSGSSHTETYWLGPNGLGVVKWVLVDGTTRKEQQLRAYVLN